VPRAYPVDKCEPSSRHAPILGVGNGARRASCARPRRVLISGDVIGIDQVPRVPAPQAVLTPVKVTGKAANAVAGEALVKALIATDLAYCVLIREPVWRMSGIRLP
jgi:hypothetical protein